MMMGENRAYNVEDREIRMRENEAYGHGHNEFKVELNEAYNSGQPVTTANIAYGNCNTADHVGQLAEDVYEYVK